MTSDPGSTPSGDETAPLPTGAEPAVTKQTDGGKRSKPTPRPKASRPTSPPPSGPPPGWTPPPDAPSTDASSIDAPSTAAPSTAAPSATPEATEAEGTEADRIRAEIEATRADLGDTVDALSAKLDVKSRVDEKRAEVTETVKAKVDEGVTTAKQGVAHVQDVATDDQGKPTPPAIGAAAGAGVLVLLLLLLRRRRRKRRNALD